MVFNASGLKWAALYKPRILDSPRDINSLIGLLAWRSRQDLTVPVLTKVLDSGPRKKLVLGTRKLVAAEYDIRFP